MFRRVRICMLSICIFLFVYFCAPLYKYSQFCNGVEEYSIETPIPEEENKIKVLTGCNDRESSMKISQTRDFFILNNFVRSSKKFSCHESVTYTTQGDYTFLDNLPTLIERWMGPISLALYAPGDDFHKTLDSIAYLRNCETPLIRKYVNFHLIIMSGHFPSLKHKLPLIQSYKDIANCKNGPPYKNVNIDDLYRRKQNLTYPINLARNVARLAATTHFIFASDIELYPTPDFINKFLQMIAEHPEYQKTENPKIYVLPVFEVLKGEDIPENKTVLKEMIESKKAFIFHQKLCLACHTIPRFHEWLKVPESENLGVFTVGKRTHLNKIWEAFYVGTQEDPLFDDRLTWEGQSNKMQQGYSLCLLNYDYMVLNNAFLVHKPGIKKSKEQLSRFKKFVGETNYRLHKFIKPEMKLLYGDREHCYL